MKKIGYVALIAILFASDSMLPVAENRGKVVGRLAEAAEGLNSDAKAFTDNADRLATWAQERNEQRTKNLFIAGGVTTLVATVAMAAYANFKTKREKKLEEAKFSATVKS